MTFRYSKGLNHHLDYSGEEEEREELEECRNCGAPGPLITGLCRPCLDEEEETVETEE